MQVSSVFSKLVQQHFEHVGLLLGKLCMLSSLISVIWPSLDGGTKNENTMFNVSRVIKHGDY